MAPHALPGLFTCWARRIVEGDSYGEAQPEVALRPLPEWDHDLSN
jgi:hypothetical protein